MDPVKEQFEDQAQLSKQKHGSIPDESGYRQKDGKLYERDEKTCPECNTGYLLKDRGKYNCSNCGFAI